MSTTTQTLDIGALRRLRIRCISETGWFDTATVFGDIKDAGGAETDQYTIPWPPFGALHADNAAGFSALLEAETTNGSLRRLLFHGLRVVGGFGFFDQADQIAHS